MNQEFEHILTLGLSPEAAEKVIIAYSSFEACEHSFPGELALILCNAARVNALVNLTNIEVLRDAPHRIAKAVEKVNLVSIENQRFVDTTGAQLKRAACEIHEEQMAFAKERAAWRKEKWFWVRMIIVGCAICLASVAFSTVELHATQRITQQAVSEFKQEAEVLTTKATAVSELQRLQIARGRYNAEQKVWDADWEACKAEIKDNSPTPAQEEKIAKLRETYAELLERREAILEREKREGWTLKK